MALPDKYPTPRSAFASPVPTRWNTVKRKEVDATLSPAAAEKCARNAGCRLAYRKNHQAFSVFR